MTKFEAADAIARLHGGRELHGTRSETLRTVVYAFPDLSTADRCKAILDALLPDATGAVFLEGRLMLQMDA